MFKLKFDTDNDAFAPAPGFEIQRILKKIAQRAVDKEIGGKIMDINGNTIGDWEFKRD